MVEIMLPLDINTCELDELTTLPGIGSNIAKKIIAGRPFSSIEDLRRIEGIGEAVFERISPSIVVSPVTTEVEQSQVETRIDLSGAAGEPASVEDVPAGETNLVADNDITPGTAEVESEIPAQTQPEEIPIQSEGARIEPSPTGSKVEPAREQVHALPTLANKVPPPIKTSEVYGIAITCSVITLFLSLALTFGIFYLINNGLRYVSPAELSQTESKLTELSSQTSALTREIETLRTRLDNLESIAGRVTAVEKDAQQLRSEMDALNSSVETIDQHVITLDSQLQEVQNTVKQFRTFLEGLKGLLENLPSP
jgi:competence ComEA-like helix-hairpin-helix protein